VQLFRTSVVQVSFEPTARCMQPQSNWQSCELVAAGQEGYPEAGPQRVQMCGDDNLLESLEEAKCPCS
jgi:hypothetical protein